jgi:hypothetical protein
MPPLPARDVPLVVHGPSLKILKPQKMPLPSSTAGAVLDPENQAKVFAGK